MIEILRYEILVLPVSQDYKIEEVNNVDEPKMSLSTSRLNIVFFTFLLCFLSYAVVQTMFPTMSILDEENNAKNISISRSFRTQQVTHDPIIIMNNSDFAAQATAEGWEGSGTFEEPYIIENYQISTTETRAIDIQHTRVHFRISNIIANEGIQLYNVTNGQLVGNSVRLGNFDAYSLVYSCNNSLIGNTATDNFGHGVILTHSSNFNNLTDNFVTGSSLNGFYIRSNSHSNRITNNTANANNRDGFYLSDSCDFNILDNNTANDNLQAGFSLDGYESGTQVRFTNNNTLSNNVASNNGGHGFYLHYNCNFNILINNTATYSSLVGFELYSFCSFNTYINNSAIYNQNFGFRLFYNCEFNEFKGNTAKYTNGYGIAVDNSNNNSFYLNIVMYNSKGDFYITATSSDNIFEENLTSPHPPTSTAKITTGPNPTPGFILALVFPSLQFIVWKRRSKQSQKM